MSAIKDFEDLIIYQSSRELAKQVYAITKQGEFKCDSRFVQQIRASSGSVCDNIAEGFERQGNKEFVNFLYIAKGSCGEVRSQLNRAHDVGFIDDETYNKLYSDCKKLSVGILRFIQSLKETDFKGSKYNPSNPRTRELSNTRTFEQS